MIKKAWYQFVKFYFSIGLFFLTKKITVHNKHNIPKKGAVLFIANHQNAFIDAILIPTTNPRNIHFLTRAGVFKNKIVAKILDFINMIPIYRVRDGLNSVEKNVAIFEKCFNILKDKKTIEIFAEGEHHLERRVIPLKKGFARIILGTITKYPELDIKIVPVGINYDSHVNYPSSASIYYGEPINANDFIAIENPDLKFTNLIKVVYDALKKLTLHVEDLKNYDAIIEKLEANGVNYLNPTEANDLLKNIDLLPNKPIEDKNKKLINWFYPLQLLAKINSFFPLLIWRKLQKSVKDIVFTNTFRFALIIVVFPLFYVLQTTVVYVFFNFKYACIYLISSILLGIISTKTTPIRQ